MDLDLRVVELVWPVKGNTAAVSKEAAQQWPLALKRHIAVGRGRRAENARKPVKCKGECQNVPR